MITGKQIKFLCAVCNSKVVRKYFEFVLADEDEYTYASKETIVKTPILKITAKNSSLVEQIENYAEKILASKKSGKPTADLERQIDLLVYKLYDLTPAEISLLESPS